MNCLLGRKQGSIGGTTVEPTEANQTYHSAVVQLICESLEVISRTKVLVQAVQVLLPVAMVRLTIAGVLWQVLNNGRNPDLRISASVQTSRDRRIMLTAVNPMSWM